MAMQADFTAKVMKITGRKVIQFMSQLAFDPDVAAEVFALKPEGDDAAVPE